MPQLLILLTWFLILVVALMILLKSADYFVNIAGNLGKKLKIPAFVIGATVVAFGTSLPELAVGITSILRDQSDIVTGTIIGSNIANIYFITGVAILISSGFSVRFNEHKMEFFILIVATGLACYFLWDGHVDMLEAISCIVVLALYLSYIFGFSKTHRTEGHLSKEDDLNAKKYALFALSVIGVWAGSKFTTDAILKISSIIDLGSDIISQTLLALGTSLPELAVTVAAVRSKQFQIVLGNVIGSNIFNLLAVLGIPALAAYLSGHPYIVQDIAFKQFSVPMLLMATTILVLISAFKATPRFFGVLFLLLYIFFMVGSFMRIDLLGLL